MSQTEIVAFNKGGEAIHFGNVENAFRGAMAIWKKLEEKYLDTYRPNYLPAHIPVEKIEEYLGFKPSRTGAMDEQAMKEIWSLYSREEVSIADKIVLGTTFDRALVKRENFEEVIAAFLSFEGETSLKEQAEQLKEMLLDETIIAAGWNQTSVTQNQWTCADYDEENDVEVPYNCLKNTNHFWLFDDINKMRK